MTIEKIVNEVNAQLAGELLSYNDIRPFLNEVIDDINSNLDSKFPSFDEFNNIEYPEVYPDYNFFPDKYIRSVVIKGAAFKWFVMDEEGIPTAQQFNYNYQDQLFIMLRDYLEDVPDEFKADHKASVVGMPGPASNPSYVEDYLL